MRRGFDSLLGRLALVMALVVVASHASLFYVLRNSHDEQLLDQVRAALHDPQQAQRARPGEIPDWGARREPPLLPAGEPERRAGGGPEHHEGPPHQDIALHLSQELGQPVALHWRREPRPTLWVGIGTGASQVWYHIPMKPGEPGWFGSPWMMLAVVTALSLMGSLFVLWQLSRPIASLADALRRTGAGHAVAPLPVAGPLELRELTTNFNQMVQDLSRLETDRQTLLAGVSHDLRTPLTRLRVRAELLDDSARAGIGRDIDDIERIVEQFLLFARLQADSEPASQVELGGWLTGWLGRDEYTDIGYRPALQPVSCAIHPIALARALANLVENARQYGAMPIELSLALDGTTARISVRDHGPGIPPERLEQARQAFVRLDAARGGRGHCGLGLAIVDQVARLHGGELLLTNAMDGGLLATLSLPLGRAPGK
ncbi:ATP-binding protein [Chitinivorax sp. PXF-14]|uniref:ATP-binding protein n=1 Tax=Chitinivorax sp. PXF-14 TaxID=3230488 RepID=UPI00346629C4